MQQIQKSCEVYFVLYRMFCNFIFAVAKPVLESIVTSIEALDKNQQPVHPSVEFLDFATIASGEEGHLSYDKFVCRLCHLRYSREHSQGTAGLTCLHYLFNSHCYRHLEGPFCRNGREIKIVQKKPVGGTTCQKVGVAILPYLTRLDLTIVFTEAV